MKTFMCMGRQMVDNRMNFVIPIAGILPFENVLLYNIVGFYNRIESGYKQDVGRSIFKC